MTKKCKIDKKKLIDKIKKMEHNLETEMDKNQCLEESIYEGMEVPSKKCADLDLNIKIAKNSLSNYNC